MKNLLFIFFFSNLLFAQQKIEIKILNTPSQIITALEPFSISYSITNHSKDYYKIIIDSTGFNTGENEAIDELYLGLPDLRIYDENSQLIKPNYGGYPQTDKPIVVHPSKTDLDSFRLKYNIVTEDFVDLNIMYKISGRQITMAPKETIYLTTKIQLPIYISEADGGALWYDLENKKKYYLQIQLNVPKKIVKKYSTKKDKKKHKYFLGSIMSNKVNFIYSGSLY